MRILLAYSCLHFIRANLVEERARFIEAFKNNPTCSNQSLTADAQQELFFDSIMLGVCNVTAKCLDSGVDANSVRSVDNSRRYGERLYEGEGSTALFLAASTRYFRVFGGMDYYDVAKYREPCIQLLLDHDADVNMQNKWGYDRGMTPIMGANTLTAMKILIDAGASVNANDGKTDPILQIMNNCRHHEKDKEYNVYDGWPCVNKIEMIKMLVEAGANVTDRHVIEAAYGVDLTDALPYKTAKSFMDKKCKTLDILLAAGGNPNARDTLKWANARGYGDLELTAAQIAYRYQNLRCARKLGGVGAKWIWSQMRKGFF